MISLTKKEEKLIRSLHNKKYREKEGLFFVEGIKMVEEAIESDFEIQLIVTTAKFQEELGLKDEAKLCDEIAMNRISAFKTAPGVMAVLKLPIKEVKPIESDITLLIDKVQDPGNLGTIIRTADAFGIQSIICSENTVDHFSPKVVQASMGSIFRINIVKMPLKKYFEEDNSNSQVYAAHLDGENLYDKQIKTPATLIVGNESQGINDDLLEFVNEKVKIPISGGAESFNVSIATAIILSEFRRQLG